MGLSNKISVTALTPFYLGDLGFAWFRLDFPMTLPKGFG